MYFLLATHNKGKVREIRLALSRFSITIESLDSRGPLPEAQENGSTFTENARLKALHYHHLTGLPTLAEDSGLAVDELGGEPGIHSARYAPTDEKRIAKLLKRMESLSGSTDRTARFVSAICLILPHRVIEVVGEVQGRIIPAPRGDQGFGYDPVFYHAPLDKTFAQMSSEEKNGVSHRAEALKKLVGELEKLGELTADR
ncbi:MAG: RdgB/HAM1 family non-canonical purine NTP pyrophosphatase [Acidobacteriota bacterium]